MVETIRASIIIVDFFKAPSIAANIQRMLAQGERYDIEIIIIDNSVDHDNRAVLQECSALASNITLVCNDVNNGYIQACNQGAKLAKGDYLFFVNPDIEWLSSSIVTDVIDIFLRDSRIGILGTQQRNDDGTIPDTVRRFPNIMAQVLRRSGLRNLSIFKDIVARYEMPEFDYNSTTDVDWVQGSFMVISKPLWYRVGGFDSRYFIFMADPDICYKCWELGYKVHYESNILVGADGLRCSAGGLLSLFNSRVVRMHLKDALLYQLKYLFKPSAPSARSSRLTTQRNTEFSD